MPGRDDRVVTSPDHRDRGAGGADRGGRASNLKLRVVSAAVLVPLALVCAYLGGWIFLVLCLIAAGGILWEWASLVSGEPDPRILAPGWAGMLIAAALVSVNLPAAAAGTIAIEAVFAALAVAALPRNEATLGPVAWAVGGVIYAGIALLAPALLRRDPQWGLTALLFLFATVWTTDIFAYFCGRALGGPALAPRVSPNKTWEGAVGGAVVGIVLSVLITGQVHPWTTGKAAVLGLVVAVVAPIGDLCESLVKRDLGLKDIGSMLPGHGGVLDRFDAMLFVLPATYYLVRAFNLG